MSDSCPGLSTGTGLVSGSITFPVIPIPVPVPTPAPEPIDCPTQEPDPEQDTIDMLQFFDSKISGKFQNGFFWKNATIEIVCQRISKYIDNIILYYGIANVDLEEKLLAETLFLYNFFRENDYTNKVNVHSKSNKQWEIF